jgi:phosphatidylethanolamine-binding protein (PEBP) family uncharacterized protein
MGGVIMGGVRIADIRAGVTVAAIVLAVSAAVGCSGSSSHGAGANKLEGSSTPAGSVSTSAPQARTSTSAEPLPAVSIDVTVPILLKTPLLGIPERYTCDGADVSIPVRWSGIPHGTAEFALFVVGLRLTHGELSFAWAVMGLGPTSHGIPAGRLPPGAVVGRNSSGGRGYSICPPPGRRETYYVKVLALPHSLNAAPGFDAGTLYHRAEAEAKVVGFASAAYTGR